MEIKKIGFMILKNTKDNQFLDNTHIWTDINGNPLESFFNDKSNKLEFFAYHTKNIKNDYVLYKSNSEFLVKVGFNCAKINEKQYNELLSK